MTVSAPFFAIRRGVSSRAAEYADFELAAHKPAQTFANPLLPPACAAERMEVLLCATNYDPEQAASAVRRILENRVQGVAVMTSQFDGELEALLTQKKVPVVLLGSPPARNYCSNIAIDYRQALSDAIEHLYALGHRQIAVASGPQDRVSSRAFQQAAIAAMDELAPRLTYSVDQTGRR